MVNLAHSSMHGFENRTGFPILKVLMEATVLHVSCLISGHILTVSLSIHQW